MVTGDGSCDNGGISLRAWCASCLVTGHGEPVVLSQGHFSQEPLEQALPLFGVFRPTPKFGQTYANALRRRRARPGDTWHLDEVFIKIRGKTHYLWRAVDQDGNVLDILVTSRRDAKAATRFFRKLLTGVRSVPRVLVTDKLASYPVAHRRLMRSVEHRRSKYLNNRAENSHQPTRARERAMKRFTSAGHAQRFLSAFSGLSPHFRPRRHLLHAEEYRCEMANRFSTWNEVTGLTTAA
jgi:putative transposase